MSMSDPFLPEPDPGALDRDPDGDESELDTERDEYENEPDDDADLDSGGELDDAAEDAAEDAGSVFRRPVPGERLSADRLEQDLDDE